VCVCVSDGAFIVVVVVVVFVPPVRFLHAIISVNRRCITETYTTGIQPPRRRWRDGMPPPPRGRGWRWVDTRGGRCSTRDLRAALSVRFRSILIKCWNSNMYNILDYLNSCSLVMILSKSMEGIYNIYPDHTIYIIGTYMFVLHVSRVYHFWIISFRNISIILMYVLLFKRAVVVRTVM